MLQWNSYGQVRRTERNATCVRIQTTSAVRRHAKFLCGWVNLLLVVILCFCFWARMPYRPTVLSSRTQLCRACGVGARTYFVLEFIVLICLSSSHHKKNDSSITDRAHCHKFIQLGRSWTTQLQCGYRTLVPSGVGSRRCERSEGERHSHRTEAGLEQSGRRRRRCPRRSIEGNCFDVFIVSVQGMCPLLPKMSLHMVVRTAGVVRLL